MAISRPFLLAVLGAVLLGATVVAVQSARTASDSNSTPALVQTNGAATPADTAAPASGPADTLRSAFDLSALKSARFAANIDAGDVSKSGKVVITGAFATAAGQGFPHFKVNARIAGVGGKVNGGLVSLGDKAYFVQGDTGWRVPAALWTPVVDGGSGGNGSKQSLPFDVHPETWVRDVKSEGTATIAGVKTEHVSARVDPKAVVNDLSHALQQSGGDLSSRSAISRFVKRADLDVWVGKDDHIVRRLSANLVFARRSHLTVDVRLSNVNKPQQIKAPAHVRAGAPGGNFGQLAQVVAGGLGGATGASTVSLAALTSPNPGRAARAVHKHKKVVILFRNSHALDDRAMTAVMKDVDSHTKALMLTDDVGAVERYGKLVEDLGVSQTPSIVIIDRTGKAQLIEGYVDSNTLTQAVADAR